MVPKRKAPDSGAKTTQSQKFLKFFVAAEKKRDGAAKADLAITRWPCASSRPEISPAVLPPTVLLPSAVLPSPASICEALCCSHRSEQAAAGFATDLC
uniref:Uncharacterized protein n=1 Tax=Chromera velia CCMP2878 TaxID=1169474 RepID=A0A0G4IAE8_9ALVE|eukprot:Cvel_12468.t1-p1 / transcript=Cvel_12468.t1 / gene=Cvel_12468 / organism=Chromera_velia_CCMP2878 / gene_product=hypothetical protein / transcript_product=hypothetical protein / location=Cvel_scaffold817:44445-44735(+) / protein_length=97 / sequence_SO=supercontig / SO=protein_coding / is_pseudo=false